MIFGSRFEDTWQVHQANTAEHQSGTTGKGVLRTMLVHKEKICDIIPVDIVANTVICAAKYICDRREEKLRSKSPEAAPTGGGGSLGRLDDLDYLRSERLTVFNCVSGSLNPISWGEINALSQPLLLKYPSMELFRYPGALFHSSKLLHSVIMNVEHKLPALFVDFLFKITGNRPMCEVMPIDLSAGDQIGLGMIRTNRTGNHLAFEQTDAGLRQDPPGDRRARALHHERVDLEDRQLRAAHRRAESDRPSAVLRGRRQGGLGRLHGELHPRCATVPAEGGSGHDSGREGQAEQVSPNMQFRLQTTILTNPDSQSRIKPLGSTTLPSW